MPRPEAYRDKPPADWLANHQMDSLLPECDEDNPLHAPREAPAGS
ncbi:MAG TPA: hypothetical protein VK395_20055 [Gemmataceae bacterium]|nr:hypothetical protein [Gemmataceae bacterium]